MLCIVDWDLSSLVAQMVKKPPTVQENWIRSLGWEDPLEEGMATHSNILGEFYGQRSLASYSPWGSKELDTTEWLTQRCRLGLTALGFDPPHIPNLAAEGQHLGEQHGP